MSKFVYDNALVRAARRVTLSTLPRSQEDINDYTLAGAITMVNILMEKPLELCLNSNNECVVFSINGERKLWVKQKGGYWGILRGIFAASVYVFGLNSAENMVNYKRSDKVPAQGAAEDGERLMEQYVTFDYIDVEHLTAFFYHLRLLFKEATTRMAPVGSAMRPKLVPIGSAARTQPQTRSHHDVARQREETRAYNQAFVEADAYDYALAHRVQENGFYD